MDKFLSASLSELSCRSSSRNSSNNKRSELRRHSAKSSITLFIPSYEDTLLSNSVRHGFISAAASTEFQIMKPNREVSPDSAFQTGSSSEFYAAEDAMDQNDKVERWVRTTTRSFEDVESDRLSQGSGSVSVKSMVKSPIEQLSPGKILIEECVEEILMTTTKSSEDEDSEESAENGVDDDVEESLSEEDSDTFKAEGEGTTTTNPCAYNVAADDDLIFQECSNQPQTWEHNWLFKKKKFSRRQLNEAGKTGFHSIMFIPNPTEYTSHFHLQGEEEEELEENENLSYDDSEEEDEAEEDASDYDIPEIPPNFENKEVKTGNGTSKMKAEKPVTSLQPVVPVIVPDVASKPNRTIPLMFEPIAELVEIVGPNSLDSNVETLRETSQSLTMFNDTIPTPTPIQMRIAEREKEKWNNPIRISNNPYTPENLLKRIQDNSFLPFTIGNGGNKETGEFESGDFESCSSRSAVIDPKIRRDYYVHSDNGNQKDTNQTPIEVRKPPRRPIPSHDHVKWTGTSTLRKLQLPSVKDLSVQFSTKAPDLETVPQNLIAAPRASHPKRTFEPMAGMRKEIHSLTARSVPREFREGLRLAKPPLSNSNIKTNT